MAKEKYMERLLTTEEVADLLRIDPVTVRRLIMRKDLPAYRIAGEFRFAPSDLDRFLENQRVIPNIAENQFGDNFTERVRKVFALASEEARKYNHAGIGTEHIVLAIMSEKGGIAAKALKQLQVQPDAVRAEIEALHPVGTQPVGEEQPGMTVQAKESVVLAVQEAQAFGHHYIGTEHLLLGLLREEKEPGGQILRKLGVTLEKAREVVKQLLAEG
jgi:excisionase family DNA binding protein